MFLRTLERERVMIYFLKKEYNLVNDLRTLKYMNIAHDTKEVFSEFCISFMCMTKMVLTNSNNLIPKILT